MSPKEEDFDWVSARKECSLVPKFAAMKVQAERNAAIAGFKAEAAGNCFTVFSGEGNRSVTFTLEPGCISVCSMPTHLAKHKITLSLNDDGDCRYQIDGEGEYMCWQVLCRTLEKLFFDRE